MLGLIRIKVWVNGQSVQAIVDSGSHFTIVSERLATRLGLAVNRSYSIDLKQVSTHTQSIGTANI